MAQSVYFRKRQVREQRLEIVAELFKKGWSVRKICAEVKQRLNGDQPTYSKSTCWKDIQYLLKEWRESRLEDMDQAVQLELARINDTVRELWEQWERSKTDYEKKSMRQKGEPKKGKKGQMGKIETVFTERTTQQVVSLGDPAYIAEIRKQLAERRKLLGLYAPERKELTGKDGKDLNMSPVNVDLGNFTSEEKEQLLKIARKYNGVDE